MSELGWGGVVEPHRAAPVAATPDSRRARRIAELQANPRRGSAFSRWIPRIGVLAAMSAVTIVVPLSGALENASGTLGGAAVAANPWYSARSLPTTLEVVTVTVAPTREDAVVVADGSAANRDLALASRSFSRDPLPGCDPRKRPRGANGLLDVNDLCPLWDRSQQLRADAAVSLAVMNEGFRAQFGRDMCISDSYRNLYEQKVTKARKGYLAATPGESNHGWGIAVDFCQKETTTAAVWKWLHANGPVYGWANPDWALSGGSGPHEPWHWEYTAG
jgi:zinc D-Ala-D-Ala carboxypeptidase